jgi:hypothetical protein
MELKGNWWHYTFEGEIKKPGAKEEADSWIWTYFQIEIF